MGLRLWNPELSLDSCPESALPDMPSQETVGPQSSHLPIVPRSFTARQPETLRLYPLSNYTFGTKENQPEEDNSVVERLNRLEQQYEVHGMRRTCEGILICHEHSVPHVLMLQIANAFFKLPGDYIQPEDEEIDGFKKRLNERLAPTGTQFTGEGVNGDWEISDCLAQWWRPNFETFMYPFVPGHCTRPKECKKLYLIQLPKKKVLSVPKNMKLLAVPLFELYDNSARYGPQLSAIPHLLSRYNFEMVDEEDNVIAVTPLAKELDPRTQVVDSQGSSNNGSGQTGGADNDTGMTGLDDQQEGQAIESHQG
ncbi:Cleavage/polyadenylation specificity factor subunit 5 [Penicillium brevicompactum]